MDEVEVPTPDWVPAIVGRMANELALVLADVPEEVEALLIRLVTDGRMKQVWAEIAKHKRIEYKSSAEPFYPAKPPLELESWAILAQSWRREADNLRALGGVIEAERFSAWAAVAEVRASMAEPAAPSDVPPHERAMAVVLGLTVGYFYAGLRTIRRADFAAFVGQLRAQGKTGEADAWETQAAKSANQAPSSCGISQA